MSQAQQQASQPSASTWTAWVDLFHRLLNLVEKTRESLGSVGTLLFFWVGYLTIFGTVEHRHEFIEQFLLGHKFPKDKATLIYFLATAALFLIVWLQHRHHKGLIGAKDGRIELLEKRLRRYEAPLDNSGSQLKLPVET